ncbi:Mitochondrial substrate carrier family protein B [Spatholobus suberectus]|nr:Mitochondrial substrate carrier family protein B [Spatholobus suberectus]
MEAARVGVAVEGGHGNNVKLLHQKNQQQRAQMGTLSQLLAGGLAGAFAKTCTAPLARLTILFQVQGMHFDAAALSKPSIWGEASRIVNEEGFRAFWKGNLVTIAHRLPYSAVNFYAYERSKNLLHLLLGENLRGNTSADLFVHFVGGGLSGVTAATATYPLDLVRTRLAAQRSSMYYRGISHAFNTICREEGFLGLYKGLGATLLGVGPNIAISFSVYEGLRSFWRSRRPDDSTVMVSLACGSLAGVASSTATFPLDLVRRRMQLEGAGGRARVYNTSLFGTFKHIIQNEGARGLYRGILPEYYKVVPSVGIVFMTYETLKMLLSSIPRD